MELSANFRHNAGLSDLVSGLSPFPGNPYEQTISQPTTLALSNAYTPLTLNRILLSYSFMTQGLIQTVVTQPVDDAFRGGVTVKSSELSAEELKELNTAIKRTRKLDKDTRKAARRVPSQAGMSFGNSDIRVVMDTLNWARLFGGSGLIINTAQDFRSALNVEKITRDTPLEFIAADRWELILSSANVWDTTNACPYNYYGLPLNTTRVIKVLGVEAPSFIRLRLQGWGMSEIERCIRPINSYMKFETLMFELLDEAKVDVYKINGFNDALLSDDGTANVQRRVQLANRLKNYQNALAMDADDDYSQKQLTWSGLAEVWEQLRLNLSSALRIPMNKLFGQSATGFGGGEDALENYNSILEGIRESAEPLMTEVVALRCQQLFGYEPEFELEWKPLKVLTGEEQEKVRTSVQDRIIQLFESRLLTGQETSAMLKAEKLLQMDTEVSKGVRDVEPMLPNAGDPSDKQLEFDAEERKQQAAKSKPDKPK